MGAPVPAQVFRAASSIVRVGGQPEIALYGPLVGGVVTNPATAADQGLVLPEILYIDITGADATLGISVSSYPLQPGQSYLLPLGQTTNVSVNAATSGHKFSAVLWQPPVPFPPTPKPGPFPPSGPTTVLKTIPSFLYQQYADDENLQAFVASYNEMAQEYVDWYNQISLPVYTLQSGGLLDARAERRQNRRREPRSLAYHPIKWQCLSSKLSAVSKAAQGPSRLHGRRT